MDQWQLVDGWMIERMSEWNSLYARYRIKFWSVKVGISRFISLAANSVIVNLWPAAWGGRKERGKPQLRLNNRAIKLQVISGEARAKRIGAQINADFGRLRSFRAAWMPASCIRPEYSNDTYKIQDTGPYSEEFYKVCSYFHDSLLYKNTNTTVTAAGKAF